MSDFEIKYSNISG